MVEISYKRRLTALIYRSDQAARIWRRDRRRAWCTFVAEKHFEVVDLLVPGTWHCVQSGVKITPPSICTQQDGCLCNRQCATVYGMNVIAIIMFIIACLSFLEAVDWLTELTFCVANPEAYSAQWRSRTPEWWQSHIQRVCRWKYIRLLLILRSTSI